MQSSKLYVIMPMVSWMVPDVPGVLEGRSREHCWVKVWLREGYQARERVVVVVSIAGQGLASVETLSIEAGL